MKMTWKTLLAAGCALSMLFTMPGSAVLAEELQDRGLSDASCCDLEQHAYSVADHIQDPEIRNMHILSGVKNA